MHFDGTEHIEPNAAPSVLAVDDDPTSRVLVGAALEGYAGLVVEAENGLAALQAMEKQNFDIAVLDLDMPVMDGFSVIERARARPATRHLPIIVTTGRDDVVSIERAFALGATSFLCKPINWNIFRHQVSYVLQVARVEREARAARERAEQIAALREHNLAALEAEVESAIAKISFLSGKGPEASLAEIFASGEKLQIALARIKRCSDILSGTSAFESEFVAAADIAVDAVEKIRATLGSNAADRIEIGGGQGLEVMCDRARAAEALSEILANAVAASPPGKGVRLDFVPAPAGRVRFEIADAGAGLPESVQRWLDGPRTGTGRAAATGRLGLGLAIAKAIVARHGGHFGIMSEAGRGTEVFLSFPAAPARQGERSVGEASQIFAKKLARIASTSVS